MKKSLLATMSSREESFPALVVIDAVSRLIPGVLGCCESAEFDSFQDGLLEHPTIQGPQSFVGWKYLQSS